MENNKFPGLKTLVFLVLFGQCILIGITLYLIFSGQATWISYILLVVNIVFGAMNFHTLIDN